VQSGTPHRALGRRLAGKYELVELAGLGGMAEVFRAYTHGAEGFRRTVAVKRILDHLSANPEFVGMFVEEARVTAALSHPNIASIHDFGQDRDGAFFLVLEWVDGVTLLDWRQAYDRHAEATPWPLVAAIGIEVLKALGAAHENTDEDGFRVPVYHRDVTPQNVMIGVNGVVKLTDFGLARAMDRARVTQPEIVKGKVAYLAPELLQPGSEPTVQTDVFGFGIVLWEVLAGRKLFEGPSPIDVLLKLRDARVPSLQELRPDIPRALHDAIHKALAKEPGDRHASARAMVRALANILRMTPESTSAEVVGRTVRVVRERMRPEGSAEVTISDAAAVPLTRKKA
jgi:eukaryotic-like serine/threonine-protein kinase